MASTPASIPVPDHPSKQCRRCTQYPPTSQSDKPREVHGTRAPPGTWAQSTCGPSCSKREKARRARGTGRSQSTLQPAFHLTFPCLVLGDGHLIGKTIRIRLLPQASHPYRHSKDELRPLADGRINGAVRLTWLHLQGTARTPPSPSWHAYGTFSVEHDRVQAEVLLGMHVKKTSPPINVCTHLHHLRGRGEHLHFDRRTANTRRPDDPNPPRATTTTSHRPQLIPIAYFGAACILQAGELHPSQ